jgi:hypothetical protein
MLFYGAALSFVSPEPGLRDRGACEALAADFPPQTR